MLAFVSAAAPTGPGEEKDSVPIAIPKGMIDEQFKLIDMRFCFSNLRRHLLKGNKQGLRARPRIDDKDPIVFWMINSYRPVVGSVISSDRTKPSHAGIVDSRERASGLFYSAIAYWIVAKPKFFNPLSLFDIIEDCEYFSGFGITVIEEKLCDWKVWIPVKHSALLRIPAQRLVHDFDLIIVFCVD